MVHLRPKMPGLEKVHRIQVGHVNPAGVWGLALGPVLLHVHAEEADVHAVLLLEGKHGPGAVREVVRHLTRVNVPGQKILGKNK